MRSRMAYRFRRTLPAPWIREWLAAPNCRLASAISHGRRAKTTSPRPRPTRKETRLPKKTLFLNPPSFEGFDGGAGSRWPSTREIESYWYPVWLCYPAGMLEGSRVLDAPPHGVSIEQTVAMAPDFEFLVLFTSSPGFH